MVCNQKVVNWCFNKSIKITKIKNIKHEMTVFKLDSKDFDISIGERVLSTELIDNGKYPVYSANVYKEFGRINKQNITDFSKPSIVWAMSST